MASSSPPILSVLFCCLGNICRSPMAEGAFRDAIEKLGYADKFSKIDSCGTAGYHAGDSPDPRTIATLQKFGISLDHRARQVRKVDFDEFDYILAMDENNLRDLQRIQPKGSKANLLLFGHFSESEKEVVEDPYYGGNQGFATNFHQIVRFTKGFCREVLKAENVDQSLY